MFQNFSHLSSPVLCPKCIALMNWATVCLPHKIGRIDPEFGDKMLLKILQYWVKAFDLKFDENEKPEAQMKAIVEMAQKDNSIGNDFAFHKNLTTVLKKDKDEPFVEVTSKFCICDKEDYRNYYAASIREIILELHPVENKSKKPIKEIRGSSICPECKNCEASVDISDLIDE